MGLRSMLAKSALKYAGEKYRGYRQKREVQRVDLAPVLLKLDLIAKNQPPLWVHYAILILTFLTFVAVIWILVRT